MSTSSPIEDSESEVSDLPEMYSCTYVIRLTPLEKYTVQDFIAWLEGNINTEKYVIAVETDPQVHLHVVLETDDPDFRTTLRQSFLYTYWPDGQRPRGWGNKQYNLQESEDVDLAISYALKMKGDSFVKGYTAEYIEERKKASFPKNKRLDFKTELLNLRNNFLESDMTTHQFMISLCQLKARYDQQVNMHHIYNFALSIEIKRDPSSAENLVESFLYKQ